MIIKNFLFHRVNEENNKFWPAILPKKFDSIIKFLIKKYKVVSLETFLNYPNDFTNSSKPLATISFDDGYKDNIEYAAPILRKWDCPASFYIVTECIEKNIPTWTYIIDNVLQNTTRRSLELDLDFVPHQLKKLNLSYKFLDQQNSSVKKIKPFMKTLSNKKRMEIMNTILEQCNDVELNRSEMLNWEEVISLKNEGFIIGSHSHTHPMLARLEDENEIKDELEISLNILKQKLQICPDSISYPIGSFDKRVMHLAGIAGYKYGLAVEQKFYNYSKFSLFDIPRVELYDESFWKTRMRISGLHEKIKRLWQQTKN